LLKKKKKEKKEKYMEEGLNSTRTFDELREEEAELQRTNKEDQALIQEKNFSPSDKETAEGTVAERSEELTRLQTQTEEREKALPLGKIYGITVTTIFLADGSRLVLPLAPLQTL